MVGVTRFELATPSSRTMCATSLRYTPTWYNNFQRSYYTILIYFLQYYFVIFSIQVEMSSITLETIGASF